MNQGLVQSKPFYFYQALTTLCLFCMASGMFGQSSGVLWNVGADSLDQRVQRSGLLYHPALQPISPFQNTEYGATQEADSTMRLSFSPVLDLAGGISNENRGVASGFAGGELRLVLKNKFFAQAGYTANYLQNIGYLEDIAALRGTLAGVGKSQVIGDGYFANYFYGRANYQAGKRVNIEVGNGKQHWGDGFRSLVLSDNAPAYPYMKFQLDVWRVRYNALYGMLKQGDRKKFFATHGFSFNAGKRLQFTFYEMVIWQATDSLNNRTLDLHYLNPILFYRPVEYAQGSADNVLLGAGFKWRPLKKWNFYGQIILDEFLLSQVKASSGWWANKFGGQIGFQLIEPIKGLTWRSEINAVRPFTYSHGSPIQSWGHMYQPLAHPLGANFSEWINEIQYKIGQWTVYNVNMYAARGEDADLNGDGTIDNMGGDIFISYATPYKDFGNNLLQGERHTYIYNQLSVARSFKKYNFLEYYVSHIYRSNQFSGKDVNEQYIMVGIRLKGQKAPNRVF
ncbi:MAG: hypothetical protein R2809_06590 [Flavobacteriales bacterium]